MYPNWFEHSHAKQNFERFAPKGKQIKCLQVGAYTGDATRWIVDNMLTEPGSTLIDVDTWEGSDEAVHKQMDWNDVFETYKTKNADAIKDKKVFPIKESSDTYFAKHKKEQFDFIYIDGDHTAFNVIRDATNAYRLLKVGGVLALDDYIWTSNMGDFYDPRPAIDWFANISGDRLETIILNGQAWYRKLK